MQVLVLCVEIQICEVDMLRLTWVRLNCVGTDFQRRSLLYSYYLLFTSWKNLTCLLVVPKNENRGLIQGCGAGDQAMLDGWSRS